VADHQQHVLSPTIAAILASPSNPPQVITARDVAALLDSAGIKRAALLSVAYMYGSPSRTVEDEYAKVRAENDWTGAQAAEYPGRFRALCSFNPLDNPAHVEQLRRVFRAANEHRMAIVVHLRASTSRKRPYGAAQARVFLEQLLPLVPNVPVQVAHLAGTGPGYDDPPSDSAMAVLAETMERHDPRTR
jgi:predicted TIM-barrel fold metal-dependent hydrolase